MSLTGQTVRGMAWAYGSFVAVRVSVLVFTALLARILSPDDFGLVALALVFIAVLETVYDFGLTSALVILDDKTADERAHTAFTATVGFAIMLAVGLSAVSPAAADFFDEPAVIALLPALSTVLVIRALGNTHYALAQKRLDFRTRSAAEISEIIARGLVGLGTALAGLGPWSLVLGYVSGSACSTIVLWALVPWRPRLALRLADLRGLAAFGGAMTGVGVMSAVIANIDDLMVGRVLGSAMLGLYTLAFKLPDFFVLNVSVVGGRVLYPAFAAAGSEAMGRNVLQSLRYTLLVCAPLAAGLVATAHSLTLALFGEEWLGSVPAAQVLTLYALAITVEIPAGTYYKATGRADILLKLAIPRVVVVIVSLAVVADDGIVAVAVAQAGVAVAFCLLNTALASRRLAIGARAFWQASWPQAAAATVAGGAAYIVTLVVEAPAVALLLGGCVGAVAYGGLLWAFARPLVQEVQSLASARLPRPSHRTAVPAPPDVTVP